MASRQGLLRVSLLLAGVLASQAILFGPSLLGRRILLPLEVLAWREVYLPQGSERHLAWTRDAVRMDQVLMFEFDRRFAAEEFRAGRVPLWIPHAFAGAPFATSSKYSPFQLPYYLVPRPETLAWIQVATSAVAALGAYLFFRRVLSVGFWPAAFGAWALPLTGFYMYWQGCWQTWVSAWLPWMLLFTDGAIRRRGWSGVGLAVTTALAIVSGVVTVAAHVLIASGAYAVWCLFDAHGRRWLQSAGRAAIGRVLLAWSIGLALSAPYLWPLLEYSQSGARMAQRGSGMEERPPGAIDALPQAIVPEAYETNGISLVDPNILESAAAGYVGLLVALVLAPLAWASRRHRSLNVLWVALVAISFAWVAGIPGLVGLLRLPGLNMLSHNRFVFVGAFAVLSLAVVGVDVLASGVVRRRWFLLPAGLVLALGAWCLVRAIALPASVVSAIQAHIGPGAMQIPSAIATVEQLSGPILRAYLAGAILCAAALAAWLAIAFAPRSGARLAPWIGAACLAELLRFAYGLNPQSDPALFYPRLPVLQALSAAPPGRVLPIFCLPARLLESHGLRDVRGYDGVDPERIVELLRAVRLEGLPEPEYARTQSFVPNLLVTPEGGPRVPPVLSMLNVRYLVFPGEPSPAIPVWTHAEGYFVWENPEAMPRAFVPSEVVSIATAGETLARLASPDFDPHRTAFVDRAVDLAADLAGGARGSARIVREIPCEVTLELDMETPGLVVLADQWDSGWRADLDGRDVPVLRANHALRGVVAPAGRSTLVFRYEPASVVWGVRLALAGAVLLAVWIVLARRADRSAPGGAAKGAARSGV